uniref:helix-turn-helix domain-containing protein n=1 Tax=Fulvivirga sp. TaxID=1931237 RepID=UPI00404AEA2F
MTLINNIILFGSLHGFFLCITLVVKGIKKNITPNLWFGGILFFLSFYLLERYIILEGLMHLHFTIFTYPLLFFIGPLVLLYTRSLFGETIGVKNILLSALPGFALYLAFIPLYLSEHSSTGPCTISVPVGYAYLTVLIQPWVFFSFTPIFLIIAYFKIQKNKTITFNIRWFKTFIYSLLLFSFVSILIVFLASHYPRLGVFDWCLQLITLCIIIHSIGYKAIMEPGTFSQFQLPKTKKYSTSSINKTMSTAILSEIKSRMEEEKLYLNQDLTIQKLADDLNISRHKISQVINQELNVTFLDFINQYRVNEAKAILQENCRAQKINQLALDVGFNNKVSFYRAFNKFTGTSPGNFQQNPSKTVTSDRL